MEALKGFMIRIAGCFALAAGLIAMLAGRVVLELLPPATFWTLFAAFGAAWVCFEILREVRRRPYVCWQEQVKLVDGRTIVVEQRRRNGTVIAHEAWLTITLPELGDAPIEWYGMLLPLVLNLHQGRLYLVAYPPTAAASDHYCCSGSLYVPFIWEAGDWRRISLAEVPPAIHHANLLIDDIAPRGVRLLELARKEGATLNARPAIPARYKRIDPLAQPVFPL